MVHPRAWLERRRARAEADYWIRHGFEQRAFSGASTS